MSDQFDRQDSRIKAEQARKALNEIITAITAQGYSGKATLQLTSQNGRIQHVIENRERSHFP